MIQKGNVVSVHYTGTLTNGEMFDSSQDREPLTFQVGSGQIIPGFENAIIGKNVGDSITVNILPQDGYGEIREDLIVRVDKAQMPGQVEAGMQLQAQADNGQALNVTVKEVHEDHVMIDGNHPLAGQELVFTIEVLEVQ
jgi:peptidylprolyl isomerase